MGRRKNLILPDIFPNATLIQSNSIYVISSCPKLISSEILPYSMILQYLIQW
jgi:hypothetical protein